MTQYAGLRGLVLVPHLLFAAAGGLLGIVGVLVVLWVMLVGPRDSAASLGTVAALGSVLIYGAPAVVYIWLIRRWWATGIWWPVALCDAVIAVVATANLKGNLEEGRYGDPKWSALVVLVALLAILGLIATRSAKPKAANITPSE